MTLVNFLPGLAGGALIGAAAVLLYATLGRVAGVSGIAFGSLWSPRIERHWRAYFLAGLVAGGWLAVMAGCVLYPAGPASLQAAIVAIVAGLLVGFGTRLGNGCTSGHGICGLARFSARSLAAVLTFMALGMITATLLRPLFA